MEVVELQVSPPILVSQLASVSQLFPVSQLVLVSQLASVSQLFPVSQLVLVSQLVPVSQLFPVSPASPCIPASPCTGNTGIFNIPCSSLLVFQGTGNTGIFNIPCSSLLVFQETTEGHISTLDYTRDHQRTKISSESNDAVYILDNSSGQLDERSSRRTRNSRIFGRISDSKKINNVLFEVMFALFRRVSARVCAGVYNLVLGLGGDPRTLRSQGRGKMNWTATLAALGLLGVGVIAGKDPWLNLQDVQGLLFKRQQQPEIIPSARCLVPGTSARGAERFQCASSCKAGSKFQYEPGVSYLFQYRASTASSVSGTSVEEESRHLVSATAVIRVLSACELSLEGNVPLEPRCDGRGRSGTLNTRGCHRGGLRKPVPGPVSNTSQLNPPRFKASGKLTSWILAAEQSYQYSYSRVQLEDARLETSVPGEEERRSQLDAGRQSEFTSALGRHPLQFSYQDGKIDQICPSSHDPAWVVNVKRGVLSVFQNSMGQLTGDYRGHETDVAGTCETSYYHVPTEGSSSVTVRKSKNLKACSHRTDRFISLPSTSYSAPVRSLPLIKSTQDCEQTITANRTLHESFCKEVHLFRPFSNGQNGAVTRVEQRLSFIETRHSAEERPGEEWRPVESPVRASLLFQHPSRTGGNSGSQEELVVSLLNQLRDGMQEDVQADAPRVFASLVRALKTLRYPQLLTLFSRY
uniref:Vitellogenin domain-containing protein n=1 Tax=Timema tahoe TaxID=61484 RepID=A0A7R9NXP1_9NEOP|nr:unnamed protein product [Timema tahoe]